MLDIIPGLSTIAQIAVVVLAFSVLVFVHELGHYLAARLCKVRVERFFVGFDVWGIGFKKEIKGTVYGIGILPLGGYCALAGQNDDPRKEKQTGAPDELSSKSLPARALVFAGGVILNFVFGFLVLVVAYMHGIPFIPAVIGEVDPYGPAAVYGLKTGDRVVSVNDKKIASFEDMLETIALEQAKSGLNFVIERKNTDNKKETLEINVKSVASNARGNIHTIGADPQRSRIVGGVLEDKLFPELPKLLAPGDEIISINNELIPENHGHLINYLVENSKENEVKIVVKRKNGNEENIIVPLETYGVWDMGLRSSVVLAEVAKNSVAEEAGLMPGDEIVAYKTIQDKDPKYIYQISDLQKAIIASAFKPIKIELIRNNEKIDVEIKPAVNLKVSSEKDTLLGVGVELNKDNKQEVIVTEVLPNSVAKDKIKVGDIIVAIQGEKIIPNAEIQKQVEKYAAGEIKLYVNRKNENIKKSNEELLPASNMAVIIKPKINPQYRRPMVGISMGIGNIVEVVPNSFADRQLGGIECLRGTKLAAINYDQNLKSVYLKFMFPNDSNIGKGLKTLIAEVPTTIKENPLNAGLKRRLPVVFKTAEESLPMAFIPAVKAAGEKWVNLSLMVYKVIHKLVVRDLPIDAVGGPVKLFQIIKIADDRGFTYFLYIVALISINLGVCNLLPFPVLDGGHLLFLLIEWVMGRPPPPAVKEYAQWVGIVCLLALMITITGYDIKDLL